MTSLCDILGKKASYGRSQEEGPRSKVI